MPSYRGTLTASEIEELWHALEPPYRELFAWLEGKGVRPDARGRAAFRSPMLAHPLDLAELPKMDPAAFMAEWKWDDVRVQIVGEGAAVRLYSRSGDEMTATFPDIVDVAPSASNCGIASAKACASIEQPSEYAAGKK